MTSRERKELVSQGNHLSAAVTLNADTLDERGVSQVRQAFTRSELIKVRLATLDRETFAQAVQVLVERVPCTLVKKIGRVALLQRPQD